MEGHVKALGIIYMVLGCLGALAGLGMLLLFGGLAGAGMASGEAGAEEAAGMFGVLGGFIFMLTLLMCLPSILVGWGLLKRKSWSRIGAIILGVLSLPGFPIGTAIGVYSLWAMLNKDTLPLFQGGAVAAGGTPRI